MNLDIRTIVVISSAVSLVSLVVIIMLWRQARGRFAGTHYWVWDYLFQAVSMLLIAMRGNISDWFSMVLANAFIAGALLVMYEGLRLFFGLNWPRKHNYILVACFIAIQWYFSMVNPNLIARNYNLSAIIAVLCFQSFWAVLKASKPGQRNASWLLGSAMAGFWLAGLARIVIYLLGHQEANDYFQSGTFEAWMISAYLLLNILTTYSLVLLVIQCLGREIKEQEEIFSKAFRSAPYAVILTETDTGKIIDVNRGFEEYSGLTREQAIGRTTLDLELWNTPADRDLVVSSLKSGEKVYGQQFAFRIKDGRVLHGLFAAEFIEIKGRKCILSSIADVTELQTSRKNLVKQLSEIKAINNAMLDREDRIIELKKEVNKLLDKIGEAKKYGVN